MLHEYCLLKVNVVGSSVAVLSGSLGCSKTQPQLAVIGCMRPRAMSEAEILEKPTRRNTLLSL